MGESPHALLTFSVRSTRQQEGDPPMLATKTTGLAALLSALVVSTALSLPASAATPAMPAATAAKLPAAEKMVVVKNIDLMPVNLASKIIDSDAYMTNGTKIGEVSDIILDANNKATAVVVGVGGFLGIDETRVAIPMSKISFTRDGANFKVIAKVTKDELKAAQKAS
jgi:sporulation protein YlmC with PRC-barrel domain